MDELRQVEKNRNTKETNIIVKIDLDGKGEGKIQTDIGFFEHMLEIFKTHSKFNIDLIAKGDTHIDFHHTVEDVAIVLGLAIKEALGDKVGIERFANQVVMLDDSVAEAAIDLSGRSALIYNCDIVGNVGDFDVELMKEFYDAIAKNLMCNIYINVKEKGNKHHVLEATMKAFARCLNMATRITSTKLMSSKGVL